jgi:hypothetical protein
MLIFITTGGNVWLKQWAEKNDEMGSNPDVGKYIGVYFAFGIGGAGLVVVQTLILWIFCSIEVSNTDCIGELHDAKCNRGTAAKLVSRYRHPENSTKGWLLPSSDLR